MPTSRHITTRDGARVLNVEALALAHFYHITSLVPLRTAALQQLASRFRDT